MTRKTGTRPGQNATPINVRSGRTVTNSRQIYGEALAYSMTRVRRSNAAHVRDLDLSPETFRAWRTGKHRIDFERLRASSLWPYFFRCLVVKERKARVI